MQCLSKLFQVLVKLISKPFAKQHFESALLKEQCAAPFVVCLVLSLLSAKNRHKCNAQRFCFHYQQNLSVRLSQNNCFKELYKRSNEQPLAKSPLYLIFYQQNIGKNTMLRNFVPSTEKNLSVRLSQSSYFKALYERSNEQLLSQNTSAESEQK